MNIAVLAFSQSGQLFDILNNLTGPLTNHQVKHIKINPVTPYPFPWTADAFFDAMPECVLEKQIEIQPISEDLSKFDLFIIGYQPWFLSPPLPITAVLKNESVKVALKDKPVITVIGSRNMWINSQKSIEKMILEAGGRMVANIPFIDRTSNLISAVTILYWMLTAKKDRFLGIFPKPGISDADIRDASLFGQILNSELGKSDLSQLQDSILKLNKINIGTDILFIEKRAKRLFSVWAGLITKIGKTPARRKILVTLFKYYLIVALFMVAPVVLFLYYLLVVPFSSKKIKREKRLILQHYS